MHALVLTTVPLAQAGGGIASFIPLLLIVAVFYLLLIRPQQRKAKQHQELVSSIGVGDQVVTIGGIHGTVQTMDDDIVRIEVAPTVVITMARGAIARRVTEDDDDDTTSDELTVETDPTDTP